MDLCRTPSPSDPLVFCDKPQPCYGFHANATVSATWPGNPLPERPAEQKTGKTRKGDLALIANRAQR